MVVYGILFGGVLSLGLQRERRVGFDPDGHGTPADRGGGRGVRSARLRADDDAAAQLLRAQHRAAHHAHVGPQRAGLHPALPVRREGVLRPYSPTVLRGAADDSRVRDAAHIRQRLHIG